jgi:hypothetical protein
MTIGTSDVEAHGHLAPVAPGKPQNVISALSAVPKRLAVFSMPRIIGVKPIALGVHSLPITTGLDRDCPLARNCVRHTRNQSGCRRGIEMLARARDRAYCESRTQTYTTQGGHLTDKA